MKVYKKILAVLSIIAVTFTSSSVLYANSNTNESDYCIIYDESGNVVKFTQAALNDESNFLDSEGNQVIVLNSNTVDYSRSSCTHIPATSRKETVYYHWVPALSHTCYVSEAQATLCNACGGLISIDTSWTASYTHLAHF